jgi:hypothetical protein
MRQMSLHQGELSIPHPQYSYLALASTDMFAPTDGAALNKPGRTFLSAPVCELILTAAQTRTSDCWTGRSNNAVKECVGRDSGFNIKEGASIRDLRSSERITCT